VVAQHSHLWATNGNDFVLLWRVLACVLVSQVLALPSTL
jgi:hypothetical protein